MTERFDIAIAGAGCSGLSLAWHLLDAGFEGRRIVLVDPRTSYGRDRTWCFFDVWPHPFEKLATHRWSRWRVRASEGPWIERSAPSIAYAHLPSDAFYAAARRRLDEAGVEVRLGVKAGAIEEGRTRACLHTDAGPIDANVVFDSRPPVGSPAADVTLLQHSEGWEVEVDEDRFQPGVATLMDFAVPQDLGVHFLYVLPFDARTALVEATWFSPTVHEPSVHQAALERALDGHEYRVRHRERGVIPMTTAAFPRRIGRRVYPIGSRAGSPNPRPDTRSSTSSDTRRRWPPASGSTRSPSRRPPVPRCRTSRTRCSFRISNDTHAALAEPSSGCLKGSPRTSSPGSSTTA